MAEAQLYLGIGLRQHLVGIFYQSPQQVTLGVWLDGTVDIGGSPSDVPAGVSNLPDAITLVVVEEIVERDVLSQFRVLHNSSYQEKLYGQVDHIDVLVGIESVGEQFAHQMSVVCRLTDVAVVPLLGRLVELQCHELLVLQVQVVHVAVGGIVVDVEVGVVLKHLHQGIFHGEDTASYSCAAGINVGMSLEDFGKALHHAAGNILLLLDTQRCQFAPAVLGILADDVQSQHHLAAQVR